MGLFDKILQALDADYHGLPVPGTVQEWNSGEADGYADGFLGKPYGEPATNSEQARAGYAWGYGGGELARQDREGPGWIW